jgi:hypothetical protein
MIGNEDGGVGDQHDGDRREIAIEIIGLALELVAEDTLLPRTVKDDEHQ